MTGREHHLCSVSANTLALTQTHEEEEEEKKKVFFSPKCFPSWADKSSFLISPPVQPTSMLSRRSEVLTGHYLSRCGSCAAADGP